jgi:hypothetical protein
MKNRIAASGMNTSVRSKKAEPGVGVKAGAVSEISQHPLPLSPYFLIVSLSAAAVELEALEKYPRHFPPNCGIDFEVVTHRHPSHVRRLPELLGKCTPMGRRRAADGLAVEASTTALAAEKKTSRRRADALA